jgi:hypothetical protein
MEGYIISEKITFLADDDDGDWKESDILVVWVIE